jgi:2-beta-glucuronyltransferase
MIIPANNTPIKTKKKITLLTRHYFSRFGRKTTVHFIAEEFARRGYDVNFITVGRSRLSAALKRNGQSMPSDVSRTAFRPASNAIQTIVIDEWLHPVSVRNSFIKALTTPSFLRYGKNIPSVVEKEILDSSIFLIECGYGVAYYQTLRNLCPDAKLIYFATDPLTEVGLREEFEELEYKALPKFDLVRVAAPELAARFPAGTKTIEIPQGIDKSIFDAETQSPFPAGTKNFISIGDMAFDSHAICTIAKAEPDAFVHVFGAQMQGDYPTNIIVHGEQPFSKLVRYIKFADVGIMPYKMTENMVYLAKTSLKFLQYSYCGLPVLTPEGPPWDRENMFYYVPDDEASIESATKRALLCPKDLNVGEGVWDWDQCTDRLIEACNSQANAA